MKPTLMLGEKHYLLNHQHLIFWNKCKKVFKINNLFEKFNIARIAKCHFNTTASTDMHYLKAFKPENKTVN